MSGRGAVDGTVINYPFFDFARKEGRNRRGEKKAQARVDGPHTFDASAHFFFRSLVNAPTNCYQKEKKRNLHRGRDRLIRNGGLRSMPTSFAACDSARADREMDEKKKKKKENVRNEGKEEEGGKRRALPWLRMTVSRGPMKRKKKETGRKRKKLGNQERVLNAFPDPGPSAPMRRILERKKERMGLKRVVRALTTCQLHTHLSRPG